MPLSAKQAAFIRDPAAFKISHGSIRSSKTTAEIIDWLRWVPNAPPGPLAIIGKTRDTIGRNLLEVIEQLDPRAIKWRAGAPMATIMGRPHHIIGANDTSSESKVRGLTLAGALVDEVTLLPENFFTTLIGRLSVEGARLYGTTNPDSPRHWFKTKYLDRAEELGWSVYHFTMRDNPGLPPGYVDNVSKAYTGIFYKRFILGAWVSAEGAIYDTWDDDRHVVPYKDLPAMARVMGLGVDYGTTNATSAILIGLGVDGRLYFIDEWRYEAPTLSARLTDGILSQRLREWLSEAALADGTKIAPEWVIVDPAAASFQVQLQADGMHNTMPADNEVLYGLRTVSSLLSTDRLRVSDRCTGFIGEAPGYAWDPKAAAKGEDKPLKENDHSMDAARYAVVTTESIWRPHVALTD